MSEEKEKIYGYAPEQDVKITGLLFREMSQSVDLALKNEMREQYPHVVRKINKSGNPATEKQIEKGEYEKEFDVESTLENQEPGLYYTPTGLKLLRLKLLLVQAHEENIKNGTAKTKEQFEQEDKAKGMGVVK